MIRRLWRRQNTYSPTGEAVDYRSSSFRGIGYVPDIARPGIGLKATIHETLGFSSRKEGIAAMAAA